MTVLPGLIDGHTHLPEGACLEEFIRFALASGVTTLVLELMEPGMVGGKRLLRAMTESLAEQPLRILYTIPPLTSTLGRTEDLPMANEALIPFLEDPRCLGVGEIYWGNLLRADEQARRLRELAQAALVRGKTVEGHAAGATGPNLQAYADFGPSSCHEAIDEAQARERISLGYHLMVREGGIRQELTALSEYLCNVGDPRRLVLATDGGDPAGLVRRGYLEVAVRHALSLGLSPELVYRMVTNNVAEHFRLDGVVGSLAPGRSADLVLIPSPRDYRPQLVMCQGRITGEFAAREATQEKILRCAVGDSERSPARDGQEQTGGAAGR
jgi:adenine deaminase